MRYVRSWPAEIPLGRSYVVDQVERLVMRDYLYDCLADVGDDVLLIEWDIAVGAEELEAFAARAAGTPGRVLAAPYRLYAGASVQLDHPVWSAFRYPASQTQGGMVDCKPGDPACHVTGFGLIYLPRALVLGYLEARDAARSKSGDDWRFSDISFCGWHHRAVTAEIALDWQARPVHLHYDQPTIPGGPDV